MSRAPGDAGSHLVTTTGELIMTKTGTTLVTAMLALATATPATAAEVAGAFGKGRTHLAVIGGSGFLITVHERRRAKGAVPEPTAVD